MVDIQSLILLGLFIESTVQWAKREYRNTFTYLALIIGIIIAFSTHTNLLLLVKLPDYSWHGIVGILMFGTVIARGSNLINDLFSGKLTSSVIGNSSETIRQIEEP